MEIRYTLTLDDFVALTLHLARKGVGQGAYYLNWFLPPGLAAAVAFLGEATKDDPQYAFAVSAGLFALGYAAVFPFLNRWLIVRRVRAYVERMDASGLLGEITLALSDVGLVETTAAARSEARWDTMKGVEDLGHATYIYLTGVSAVVIPRVGCGSDAEYEAARDFALRKLADRVMG